MKTKLRVVLSLVIDLLGLPLTYLSGFWLKNIRRNFQYLPLSRKILHHLRVLPIRHFYYEPLVIASDLQHPLGSERTIPGLDLNVPEQLDLLKKFNFNSQLVKLPLEKQRERSFYYHNTIFESGDAEFLFNMIRHFKPVNIIEVGSGQSTLMARYAIGKNIEADPSYTCKHVCIEPYEQPWLQESGAHLIRQRVETINPDFFQVLDRNDLLFIDSSHNIRPQGDVLFEYLELFGTLKSGVIIHIHDIFTPRDYPEKWVLEDSKLWNEQYLLEAFLSYNSEFSVMGSLNFLWHNYRENLVRVCPILEKEADREPGSFWFVRN